jgi:serine/threonine protein phosphatase 1
MRRLLSRLLGKPRQPFNPDPLDVPGPVGIIGDVHGRADLLSALVGRLDGKARILLVGDYIDRGEESAQVLDYLIARPEIECLMGNHEAMCLAFLDNPMKHGARWLRNGGLQTLASFGVPASPDPDSFPGVRDALARSMGDERIDWLRALPLFRQVGNLVVTHAGADPARPFPEQEDRSLLWGHPDFGRTPREDGLWVAHGHVIVDDPFVRDGRIAVDTGAYATGRLTAALVSGDAVDFVSA